MLHQIPCSDEVVLRATPLLLLLLLTGLVRSGQPISGLPDDGGFDMPESILEPELAQSVWSREGLKNPIRRTTTIPLNDRLDIGNTGELQQQKGGHKPMKRMPRSAAGIGSEYDALNDDFLTEYDLLSLDFNLDDSQDGKRNAKEVEVPAKEFEWEEGEKRTRAEEDNFPPKEWWDLDEPEGTSTTAATKSHALRGSKLLGVGDDDSRGKAEEQSMALRNNQKRESGRVRRNAEAKSAGQMRREMEEWSGEAAIGRDEVKIWPKLVPIRGKSEPRPIHWPVTTTKRTSTTPKAPKESENKRISGGNDAPMEEEGKKEAKKGEIFRDLPSGIEVVASLVEKEVDSRQQSRNTTQRQKFIQTLEEVVGGRVQSKKQNRPSTPHIVDRDSPEIEGSGRVPKAKDGNLATTNMAKTKSQSEQQQRPTQSAKPLQRQQDFNQLVDSLPTITIGEPEKQSEHHSSPKSESIHNHSVPDGDPNIEPNVSHNDQIIEGALADQPPQLPSGFIYLATVDALPKNGRLLIGNRSYVIERTLQRNLFQQQRRQRIMTNGAGSTIKQSKSNDHSLSSADQKPETPPTHGVAQQHQQQTVQQMLTSIGNISAGGESARRFAPRNKAFIVASSQQMPITPAPPSLLDSSADHLGAVGIFQSGKKTNSRVASRKTDILAQNLGLALSQIFGNFTLGNFSEKNEMPTVNEKAAQKQLTESAVDAENDGRAEQVEQVMSEAHRLTRVFEKKRP